MTDGIENRARYIADVAPQINEATYALGLGTPQNTSAAALQTISGNNGGFLLITGAIGTDNRFLLQKYFLQILAGVSNADVVLDPEGELSPGRVHRIPFQLTRADAGVDVILLTPSTQIVDFRVQTPSGLIIEPWRAMSEPGMRYVLSTGVSYYRLVLPTELQADRFDQGGTWQALLTLGRPRLERTPDTQDGVDHGILRRIDARPSRGQLSLRRRAGAQRHALLAAHELPQAAAPSNAAIAPSAAPGAAPRTLPYSIIVHTYSNISLRARAEQSSYEPGAPSICRPTSHSPDFPCHVAARSGPRSDARTELARQCILGSRTKAASQQRSSRRSRARTISVSGPAASRNEAKPSLASVPLPQRSGAGAIATPTPIAEGA